MVEEYIYNIDHCIGILKLEKWVFFLTSIFSGREDLTTIFKNRICKDRL